LKKLVFTTFGSLGDLHPYIALALEWLSRGNDAVIATSEKYRTKVESAGIAFAPIRPDLPDSSTDAEMMRRVMDSRNGPEYLIRKVVMPHLRGAYADLTLASEGADGIIGHPLTFSVPLVAHQRQIPWVYVALSPIVFLSAHDPPLLAPVPWLSRSKSWGPIYHGTLIGLAKLMIKGWLKEVPMLSRDLGCYPAARDPLGADQYSPYLNLALFSSVLAAPQPDWPQNTVVSGFPFYDADDGGYGLSQELQEFIADGEPPIVFTLGTAAVRAAGSFYIESLKAATHLGKRAVLLVGPGTDAAPKENLTPSVFVAPYAAYSEIFPTAAAIVHQGGIGTTAQAMIAGKPMLIMPFAFDQPDNARRITRLGIGRTIARASYNASSAAAELTQLLDGQYSKRAETIGRLLRMESGAQTACDAIETNLFPT